MSQFIIESHRAVRKDLKKISPQAAKKIVNEALPKIVEDPFVGTRLTGVLRDYSKLVFHVEGVSYRVIYRVTRESKIVFVVAIGTREKFYERLVRRLK